MSIDISALPYRRCVGIALFNNQGKVFVGERIDTPGAWQMPQGGIDEDEDIAQAARRELCEETGIKSVDIIRINDTSLRYDLPLNLLGVGENARMLWNGQYRGQEQTWVAMRFTGHDDDINLNTHSPAEFSAYQWVNLDDTLDLIITFKRELYKQVIEIFSDIHTL